MDTIRQTAQRVAERLLSGDKVSMGEASSSSTMVKKAMKKKDADTSKQVAKTPGKVMYKKEDVAEACRSKAMLNVIAKSPGKVKRTKK